MADNLNDFRINSNNDVSDDIWVTKKRTKFVEDHELQRILPKRLAEPIKNILDLIHSLEVTIEETELSS